MNSEKENDIRSAIQVVEAEISALLHAIGSGHGTRDDEADLQDLMREKRELETQLR